MEQYPSAPVNHQEIAMALAAECEKHLSGVTGKLRCKLLQMLGLLAMACDGIAAEDGDLHGLAEYFAQNRPPEMKHGEWTAARVFVMRSIARLEAFRACKMGKAPATSTAAHQAGERAPEVPPDAMLPQPIVFEFPPANGHTNGNGNGNGKKNGKLHLPPSRPFLLQSQRMRDEVWNRIEYVAEKDGVPVLMLGETGVGKTEAAKVLVAKSPRRDKPYLYKNCAAIPEQLLESELFGHEKGAFTGAVSAEKGALEAADGGTLFLDEIGDMSPSLQAKLLHLLQHGAEYTPVGSHEPKPCNVRFIFATHRDLRGMIAKGDFREDLFHRLNRFPIRLPALHERADTPHLAFGLLQRVCEGAKMSASCADLLARVRLKGNIRELEGLLEKAVFRAEMLGAKGKPEVSRDILTYVMREEGVDVPA